MEQNWCSDGTETGPDLSLAYVKLLAKARKPLYQFLEEATLQHQVEIFSLPLWFQEKTSREDRLYLL